MDHVIERNFAGPNVWQYASHEPHELAVKACAAPVVTKDHAVLFEHILAQHLDLAVGHRDVSLAGQVDQRRALFRRKVLQLSDGSRFGLFGDLLFGADTVFDQHVDVRADSKILVPVAAGVLQSDEANLPLLRPASESGSDTFTVTNRIRMFGDLSQLQLDFVNRRHLEADRAERIDDEFLLDHFLNFDRLRDRLLLAAAGRHFIQLPTAAHLREDQEQDQEGDRIT